MTAFLAVFNLIPRWLLAGLLAAAVALYGVTQVKLIGARLSLANAQATVVTLNTAIEEANARAAIQKSTLEANVLKAKNEATIREELLRTSAASAQSESDGLRDDLAAIRGQLGQLSRDAVAERAVAISVVLDQCARRYQGLAAVADRHVSDLKTLMAAWPK